MRGIEGNLVADHQRRRFSPFSSFFLTLLSVFHCVIARTFSSYCVCILAFAFLTFFSSYIYIIL